MKNSRPLLPLIPLFILLAIFEICGRLQMIPAYLFPTPSSVMRALFIDSSELWSAAIDTTTSAAIGLFISVIGGISLGILLSANRWVKAAIYPYATFFQTVPIIAIAPLLVIWFGYGTPTVVAATAIVSIFPMIASTLAGIESTEPALLDLFKIYRASKFETMIKLRLPFALPQIFIGLRISAGLAVIGAIVGEFIAGGGLGGTIDVARARQNLDQLFAAVLLATLVGLLFIAIINLVSKYFLRNWHPSERSKN